MPDISMCKGEKLDAFGKVTCPRRLTCYRFTAKPSEGRQSYFQIAPFDVMARRSCDYYSPNDASPTEPRT